MDEYLVDIPKTKRGTVKTLEVLDRLNDQIIEFLFHPDEKNIFLPLVGEASPSQRRLGKTLACFRYLLFDAQSKFRSMLVENHRSTSAGGSTLHRLPCSSHGKLYEKMTEDYDSDCVAPSLDPETMRASIEVLRTEVTRLTEENTLLITQVQHLTRQVEQLDCDDICYDKVKLELATSREELAQAKEALLALQEERKNLKSEKLNLLSRIQQLYITIDQKEAEFRDFVCTYNERTQETDKGIKVFLAQKKNFEEDRQKFLKLAQSSAEVIESLKSQLNARSKEMKKQEEEIRDLRNELNDRHINSYTPEVISPHNLTIKTESMSDVPPFDTPPHSSDCPSKDDSFEFQSTPNSKSGSNDLMTYFCESHKDNLNNNGSNTNNDDVKSHNEQRRKRLSFGSISRVFSKSRPRLSITLPVDSNHDAQDINLDFKNGLLHTLDCQNKMVPFESLRNLPVNKWRVSHVLSWLENDLFLSAYGRKCSENIKSGQVLLDLSDSELTKVLGVTNVMHRRKLRLAIEELRDSNSVEYVNASQLDHNWVTSSWLTDVGLGQYAGTFESNLIDGRVLNCLSRHDLEKYLSVSKKSHQTSILLSIDLLRQVTFDKQVLIERRKECDDRNDDVLVWTNERVIQWIRSIDLQEYSENLKESGVNGAVMLLDPLFSADTLATILHIPENKSCVKKHLTTEVENLLNPLRSQMNLTSSKNKKMLTFPRSNKNTKHKNLTRKNSLRGSLSRAFSRKLSEEMSSKDSGVNLTSGHKHRKTRPSISGPVTAPVHSQSYTVTPLPLYNTTV